MSAAGADDNSVDARLAALDAQLPALTTSPDHGRFALWNFGRAMQAAELSPGEEADVLQRLDGFAGRAPAAGAAISGAKYMISHLSVGKTAPDISGLDLDGRPMKLSDFRGKVVLLMFSGDWCGICRAQYPYERFMLEQYKQWPFEIVAVESGDSASEAKASLVREHLTYRAFWDAGPDAPAGPGRPGSAETPGTKNGPIATRWNVVGWPATYVIDGRGVIRGVDLIQEDLLKSVRLTLAAEPARAAAAKKKSGPGGPLLLDR